MMPELRVNDILFVDPDNAEIAEQRLDIRDPYIFEFLGLKPQEVLLDLKKHIPI